MKAGLALTALLSTMSCVMGVGGAAGGAGLGLAVASTATGADEGKAAAIGAVAGYLIGSVVWFVACGVSSPGVSTMSRSSSPRSDAWYCAHI